MTSGDLSARLDTLAAVDDLEIGANEVGDCSHVSCVGLLVACNCWCVIEFLLTVSL